MARSANTIKDYQAFLSAAVEGGYGFKTFETGLGQDKVVFLRHDVDKNVQAALRMAEIEARMGVCSTYFFLLRSRLYNLLEPETREAVHAIAGLGHAVGLHCDESRMPFDRGVLNKDFDRAVLAEVEVLEHVLGIPVGRVVSFHNPGKRVVGRAPETGEYISAYDPRLLLPHTKYISDSNAVWREGDPKQMLCSGKWPRLQILVHPVWWAWETRKEPEEILAWVIENRLWEMDKYLGRSNSLWNEFRGTDEGRWIFFEGLNLRTRTGDRSGELPPGD